MNAQADVHELKKHLAYAYSLTQMLEMAAMNGGPSNHTLGLFSLKLAALAEPMNGAIKIINRLHRQAVKAIRRPARPDAK
jgi:hypothetical protein